MSTNSNLKDIGFDSDMLRIDIFKSIIQGEVLTPDSTDLSAKTTIGGSLESQNFLSGSKGYYFDNNSFEINSGGKISGDIIIGGSISGSSLHIPDKNVTANSFHTDSNGNSWWGCTETNFNADNNNATAYILNTGVTKLQSSIITGSREIEKTYAETITAFSPIKIDSNGEVANVDLIPRLTKSINTIEGGNIELLKAIKLNEFYFGILYSSGADSSVLLGKLFNGAIDWVSATSTNLSGITDVDAIFGVQVTDGETWVAVEDFDAKTIKVKRCILDTSDETLTMINEDQTSFANVNHYHHLLDIDKVSSNKLALLTYHANHSHTLDQEYDTTSTTSNLASGGQWQSFTTSAGVYNLSQVAIRGGSTDASTSLLSIYEGQGTGGTLLGSMTVALPNLGGDPAWVTFSLDSMMNQIVLAPSTEYTIAFGTSTSNFSWFRNTTGALAGGVASTGAAHDFSIKTYYDSTGADIYIDAHHWSSPNMLDNVTTSITDGTTGRGRVCYLTDNKMLVLSEAMEDRDLMAVVVSYDNDADLSPTMGTVETNNNASLRATNSDFNIIGLNDSLAIGILLDGTTLRTFYITISNTTISGITAGGTIGTISDANITMQKIGTNEVLLSNNIILTYNSGTLTATLLNYSGNKLAGGIKNMVTMSGYALAAKEYSNVMNIEMYTIYSNPFAIAFDAGVDNDTATLTVSGTLTNAGLSLIPGKIIYPCVDGHLCILGANRIGKSLSLTSLLINI